MADESLPTPRVHPKTQHQTCKDLTTLMHRRDEEQDEERGTRNVKDFNGPKKGKG